MNCAVAAYFLGQAREEKADEVSFLACVLNQRQNTGLLGPISSILFGLVQCLIGRPDKIGRRGGSAGDRAGKPQTDGDLFPTRMFHADF